MARMRQIRDVIFERRDEEEQRRLKVEEAKLQTLAGAIHAAAGNKAGVNAAHRIRLTRDEPEERYASYEAARAMFPVGDEGLVDMSGVTF